MAERTTVRLPEELLARARQKAHVEGRTLTALIEDGLQRVLAGQGKPAPPGRKLPRVSRAVGGLMPGAVPVRFGDAEVPDELEHFLAVGSAR